MAFELTALNAVSYLRERGVLAPRARATVEELPGGVSASVIAVRGKGIQLVVKQALPRLRVEDEWLATQRRTETEVAAMRLCGSLTPGAVPEIVDNDPERHVVVMRLLPAAARNWQDEVAAGNIHAEAGGWAGTTLARWHAGTAGRVPVEASFDDFEAFEELRLRPFLETLIERRPDLAGEVGPRLARLRSERRCLVHGDYAMKNMLVGPPGRWVLDFEVAHYGNPIFDLAFFLSFVVLSAVRWRAHTSELQLLGEGFLEGYTVAAGSRLVPAPADLASHTACLILARTDGKSPALFFDPPSRERAREVGIAMLRAPESGLWAWV